MALFTINLLIALSIVLPLSTQATPTRVESLCEEVAYALNESVAFGYLTQAEADEISDRCYELFES